jgi:hypothetical protein
VLWHRRAVTGLIAWESASVGPRSIDIAHCRYNLLHQRSDATEVFMREWERHTGRTFHRWADIATIIGLLDSQRRPPTSESRTLRDRGLAPRLNPPATRHAPENASTTQLNCFNSYVGDTQNRAPGNRRSVRGRATPDTCRSGTFVLGEYLALAGQVAVRGQKEAAASGQNPMIAHNTGRSPIVTSAPMMGGFDCGCEIAVDGSFVGANLYGRRVRPAGVAV